MLIKALLFILHSASIRPLHQNEIAEHCSTNLPVYKDIKNATYVIGGLFPVHFLSTKNNRSLYKYNSPGLMWIEAMTYVIREINNSTTLLPNVTLGYQIYDTCNTIHTAIETTLRLTHTVERNMDPIPNNTCPCGQPKRSVIAVIGDAASATTTRVSSILSALNTAQISYSSTSTDLSKKKTVSFIFAHNSTR